MAFPTSPVNGQIYNQYVYNSTLTAWEKYGDIEAKGKLVSEGSNSYFASANSDGETSWNVTNMTQNVWYDIINLSKLGWGSYLVTVVDAADNNNFRFLGHLHWRPAGNYSLGILNSSRISAQLTASHLQVNCTLNGGRSLRAWILKIGNGY